MVSGVLMDGSYIKRIPYICVIDAGNKKPVVILKRAIIAVEKSGDYANIVCYGDVSYHTKNKYEDVVKALID